jgi:Domain of unknown function (DUF4440)
MKRTLMILWLVVVSLAAAETQFPSVDQSPRNAEQQLRNAIMIWTEAETQNDAPAIDKLLAPEFSFLGGSSRSQYLTEVVPDKSVRYSATVDDIRIELYGELALVTTLESVKGGNDEKVVQGKLLILTIWINRNGRWLCVKASFKTVDVKIDKA